ncbi:MAG: ATP-binding protein [Actinomycetota bacterium]|nr:ATP-binding protein [Actinomycetota bacterium]
MAGSSSARAAESAHRARLGLDVTYPSDIRYLHSARSATASATGSLSLTADASMDLALLADELVANAMRHGDGEQVRLEVWVDDGDVVVRASNEVGVSSLQPVETWRLPGADAESGRGLGIIRRLCYSIAVSNLDGWVSIECRLQVRDA